VPDMDAVISSILNKEPLDDAWNIVNVNVFGFIEMQNKWGKVTETQFKSSMHWLLMKYLLLNPGRNVPESEIYGVVWPEKNSQQVIPSAVLSSGQSVIPARTSTITHTSSSVTVLPVIMVRIRRVTQPSHSLMKTV